IAAEMINRQGISCKHLTTFNMDEYANEKGETAPADWEGSFATSMRQSFFEKLDPKLRPIDKNIHFPTHRNIEDYWKMIEDAGGGLDRPARDPRRARPQLLARRRLRQPRHVLAALHRAPRRPRPGEHPGPRVDPAGDELRLPHPGQRGRRRENRLQLAPRSRE